jgi:hypothetical protein
MTRANAIPARCLVVSESLRVIVNHGSGEIVNSRQAGNPPILAAVVPIHYRVAEGLPDRNMKRDGCGSRLE